MFAFLPICTNQMAIAMRKEGAFLPDLKARGILHAFGECNRVKEALRDKLIKYQRDCYRVLTQAFQSEE